ncbi:NB-ARC domain-containing protein [Psidium guajava]|nr:NB-ARC domain-containing protein [Psidium guajava]
MSEGKALIEDMDMPVKMQIQAMACASQALDVHDVLYYKSIAAHIKKVLPFLFHRFCHSFKSDGEDEKR